VTSNQESRVLLRIHLPRCLPPIVPLTSAPSLVLSSLWNSCLRGGALQLIYKGPGPGLGVLIYLPIIVFMSIFCIRVRVRTSVTNVRVTVRVRVRLTVTG
jgi:hypothetical protein